MREGHSKLSIMEYPLYITNCKQCHLVNLKQKSVFFPLYGYVCKFYDIQHSFIEIVTNSIASVNIVV